MILVQQWVQNDLGSLLRELNYFKIDHYVYRHLFFLSDRRLLFFLSADNL